MEGMGNDLFFQMLLNSRRDDTLSGLSEGYAQDQIKSFNGCLKVIFKTSYRVIELQLPCDIYAQDQL